MTNTDDTPQETRTLVKPKIFVKWNHDGRHWHYTYCQVFSVQSVIFRDGEWCYLQDLIAKCADAIAYALDGFSAGLDVDRGAEVTATYVWMEGNRGRHFWGDGGFHLPEALDQLNREWDALRDSRMVLGFMLDGIYRPEVK